MASRRAPGKSTKLYVSILAAALTAGVVRADDAGGTVSVDDFIKKLTAETTTFEPGAKDFVLSRPHPMVAKLPKGCEPELAKHLSDKFTGDPQKDIYIRYHIIYPLIYPASGKALPGEVFAQADKVLPDKVPFDRRQPYRFEPPEIGLRWQQLINASSITQGFPPFQKWIGPPESFNYMDAAQRAKAEAAYNEAQSLKGQFKKIDDTDAYNYNFRVGETPWMLRQVNGDILYGLIESGDPKMFDAAIRVIEQQARSSPKDASDSLAFVNAAYFDGLLSAYTPAQLKTAAATLKRVCVAADAGVKTPTPPKPAPLKPGQKAPPAQPQPAQVMKKNVLSERAFTVITAMENGTVPKRVDPADQFRKSPDFKPLPARQLTAATMSLKDIDDAIDRAVAGLEKVRAPDTDLGAGSYWAANIAAWLQQWILPGNQALANWAFLSTGENQYTPWLAKRIGWVACFQSVSTYDRSMRLRMLSKLPQKTWQPWMRRDVDWLLSTMTQQGNFGAGISDTPPTAANAALVPYGDNANGQYAVLGLSAAQDAGYEIDPRAWAKIDHYWRDAQFPAGSPDAGGWAVRSSKIAKGGDAGGFTDKVNGPMTGGGILTLATTERYLEGAKKLGVGNKMSPELAAGIQWLDTHFDINKIDGDSDLYYYLWTIQNVGQAIGYRKFNNVDWFREATVALLNKQGPDGLWKGPKGPTISTSFALLYLYRARGPLAVCKVRFGDDSAKKAAAPAWNNRPNDLQNLTDDFTEKLEVPTSWQIADLDQPVNELIESATLYLATDKPFTLSDAEIDHLRDYLNAGGLLICSPEGGQMAGVLSSYKSLAAKLYPDRELKKIEGSHPFFTLNAKVTDKIAVSTLENGVRPLMVVIEKDVSRDLQAGTAKRDSFNLLTNIYLYATGVVPKRPRMQTNYVIPTESAAGKATITAARIKYTGNFDPEPASLSQLGAVLAKQHGIALKSSTATPAELTPATQVAFLTSTDGMQLADADATALRKWIDAGGTLWIDAAGGRLNAAAAVDGLLTKLNFQPGDLKPCDDTPVLTGKTRRPGGYDVTKVGYRNFLEGDRPNLRQILSGNRSAVFVTRGDVGAALAGANSYGISGFNVDTTRGMVLNSILNLQPK